MEAIKFPILVLVLVATLCRAEILIESLTPDQSTSDLVEDLVTIVTSCYGDRVHGVVLAGELPDALVRRLSNQHSIPVVLIDNTKKVEDIPSWVPVNIRHKLPIFIVSVSSTEEFLDIVSNRLLFSIWYDNAASFFILSRSPNCKYDPSYLWVAWQLDLLNTKVICYGGDSTAIIQTLNPFTTLAPVPWTRLGSFEGRYGYLATAFVRRLRENGTTCVNLDFDKLKDCGGYPILVKGIPPSYVIEELEEDEEAGKQYMLIQDNILIAVYRALNVKPVYLDPDSHIIADIEIPSSFLYNSWNNRLVTSPFMQSSMILLSQFRGNKSQLQKILGVIDTNSHIGLAFVYLVTLMFFKFVVRQTLVPAILNLVRITCGSGFENLSRSNASRLYLTGLLFFAVTMHGIFEGNLAALLTTVIPVRNVKTMQNILDFDYMLYGYSTDVMTILSEEVKERFVVVQPNVECVMKVTHEKSSACIISLDGSALDLAKKYNLHASQTVETSYVVYNIRWHFIFEERLNKILSILAEADVLEPWSVKCNPMNLEYFQTDQDVKHNVDFKKIELGELTFAFVILGVGLTLAGIVFIIELGIHYRCKRICRVGIGKRWRRN